MTIFNFKKQAKCIQSGRSSERPECAPDMMGFWRRGVQRSTRATKFLLDGGQYGRSMIEMLGVLAIIGVLSVGGIAGYSKAMEKFKINKTIDQVTHIVANTKTLTASQNDYIWGEDAIKLGIIPEELGTDADNLVNAFGGTTYVDPTRIYNANKDYYGLGIWYWGLPKNACVTLATYDWGSEYSSGFIGLAAGTGGVSNNNQFAENGEPSGMNRREKGCYTSKSYSNGYQTTCIGQQMTVSQAAAACDCGSENTCEIFWLYQ